MAVSFFRPSRNSRTGLIVLLLLISLATASILTLHAHYSDVSQRATAESVIRDYSSLVADEVIRRSTADVGYSGYYPLAQALTHEVQQMGGIPPNITSVLLSAPESRLKRAASLAKGYFVMDFPAGSLAFVPDKFADGAAAWLRQNLPRVTTQNNGPGFQVFNTQIAGSPRTFVCVSARGPNSQQKIAGFEVDLGALGPFFGAALDRQPLVPPSLGHGQVSNAFVHVTIRDHGGIQRFQLGEEKPSSFAITKPFGDTYQGIFSGFTVLAAIDPRVSGQIVIGGLPRSRLPFFLGVLAVNAGLILTAILQLQREMALQRLRDEFVSSVSHELRTPLTQIRMFTETLLLDRIRSDDERHRSLEIIDREARRLTQLVDNVLQFSRRRRKKDYLSKEGCDLATLIQEIADDFESVIQSGQTRLECRLCFGMTANVDPDAFRQIVINLLDNAVKYGRKPQRVILGLEAREGMAFLFIDDEGPGIPLADRKRIFERFHRLQRDRQSATTGAGIGLSVVKDLVVRHGGRCWVTAGDRGGAKFVVTLPLVTAERGALKQPAGDFL